MNRRRHAGLTLIELVISIVVIAFAVTGILLVMNKTTAHSADPLIQDQAVAIGEAYLEEILGKSLTVQPGTGSRANFDDIYDYNGLADIGAHDQSGTAIAGLGSYNVSVKVNAPAPISGQTLVRIDVTVTNGTLVNMTISGYKGNY